MDSAVLPSTFLLTLLLLVGLWFFIRAATKDRTEIAKLTSQQDEATLMKELKDYFQSRAYKVTAVDQKNNEVTFEGFVRPSWFLAIFLSLLALTGLLCLSLVLSLVFPNIGRLFLLLILLAPVSGWFYWQKAGRLEKVSLKLEPLPKEQTSPSTITVIAHRDELTELQRALQLSLIN
jgi:type IV secretory pathway VirB3-like protein